MTAFLSNPKARQLLFSYLSGQQIDLYIRFGWFPVQGKDTRTYVIGDGWQVIDYQARGAKSLHVWAQYPVGYALDSILARLPLEDSILAQMLLIQTNTRELHRIACHNVLGSEIQKIVHAMMREAEWTAPQSRLASLLFGRSSSRLWG